MKNNIFTLNGCKIWQTLKRYIDCDPLVMTYISIIRIFFLINCPPDNIAA